MKQPRGAERVVFRRSGPRPDLLVWVAWASTLARGAFRVAGASTLARVGCGTALEPTAAGPRARVLAHATRGIVLIGRSLRIILHTERRGTEPGSGPSGE